MNNSNANQTVSEEQIVAFVAHCQSVVDAYMAARFPTLGRPVISYELGRRYARIVISQPHRSCFGFVDMTNGDLLKSAGWKAPAKNFPRGNVLRGQLNCVGWAGIG